MNGRIPVPASRPIRQRRPIGRRRPIRGSAPARALALAGLVLAATALGAGSAAGHGPDPFFAGGAFGQNQDLRFKWRSGSEPVGSIKAAIKAAAADVTASRASKAATFTYDAGGSNPIGYGPGATCGVNGLACFTRTVPDGFTMWLREQGHVFDWGTLKWCQTYANPPNGCYDAETIALDEFGHVEGLDHHVNLANEADYQDAVVQTVSRTRPAAGWNQHAFGPCDVATLQLEYDMASWAAKYSTCLELATNLTVTASPVGIIAGASTTLTASLRVADDAAYRRLGNNPVSNRTVTLQRRTVGAATWVTVGTMVPATAAGTYSLTQKPTADTDYRAVFGAPSGEGLDGDTSPSVRVYVSSACSGSVGGLTPDAPCA